MSELTIVERATKALSINHTEEELKELANKYADVTTIKDDTDYDLVKRGGIEIGKVRVSIEKAGKAARDDANKFRTAVIAEEKRLKEIVQPEEVRLKSLRKAVDDEAIHKAAEVLRIEQSRVADITARIQGIKEQTEGLLNADSIAIQTRLDTVKQTICSEVSFAEFLEQADEVKADAISSLESALTMRKTLEDQQAAAARVAEEQAKQQAEIDRQAAEQGAREDKIRQQQQAIEDQHRAEEDKKLAVERAEAAKVKAEKDRLEREASERDHAERVKAEQEAEAARKEALRPEKERLIDWLKKLRFIDGVELHDRKLVDIQVSALKGIEVISTASVKLVENV